MESLIKIAGKELPVHVSIRTIIDYKSTFGTDIFEDLEKAKEMKEYLERNFIANEDGFCHVCKIDRQGAFAKEL